MRDYVRLFYTSDSMPLVGTNYIYPYYFFKTAADCQAFIDANPVSPGGGTLSGNSPIWFRLNANIVYGQISSAGITNIGTPDNPVRETFPDGEPIIYFENPRDLGINSQVESAAYKSKTSKSGKISISFSGYLELLAQQWARLQYPKRWQDALATVILHYESAKVTQSQVNAWLVSIDLSAKATTI